jgi:hypothetical protein
MLREIPGMGKSESILPLATEVGSMLEKAEKMS